MRPLLALVLIVGLVAPVRGGDDEAWRDLRLSSKRRSEVSDELARALKRRWRKRLLDFDLRLQGTRIRANGRRAHLLADGGHLELRKGTLGDLPISAEVEFGPFGLDYGALGVGKLDFVREAHITPRVTITLEGLSKLLSRGGFVDVGVDWDEAAQRLELRAARPVKFLFFRFRPRFTVRARLLVEGTDLGVVEPHVDIRGIPRFLARIAGSKVARRLERRVDLNKDYRKLARRGIRVAGGVIRVIGPDGPILVKEVPGDPELGD